MNQQRNNDGEKTMIPENAGKIPVIPKEGSKPGAAPEVKTEKRKTGGVSGAAARENYRDKLLFDRREEQIPHMSYTHEKLRHQVITDGRVDLIEAVAQIPPDGSEGTVSRDALRNRKNMFIAAITLFTRAAMDGGLPEELAYAMSDSFILLGEAARSFEEIEQLYMRAWREFTEAVAEEGNSHYCTAVEAAIEYIHVHLHDKITLQDAAEAAGISPCHLSRIFKRDTGMSMVEYIQRERVSSARHMLIYSDYSIAMISEYLHFSSQSYFGRIFEKYTGMTPGQYKRNYHKKISW